VRAHAWLIVVLGVACRTGAAGPAPPCLPVFPGAEGFGVCTPAGRGGRVLRVTTLADGGPGSLRAAVEAAGSRTVIFEISGTIVLSSWIRVRQPYLTIAGQTAPPPGITLRGAGLDIETHDVLVRHLRLRPGDDTLGAAASNRDAVQVVGAGAYNVVLDHVSASWAVDENASTYYGPRDITISNSIISEGLSHSLHPEGEHSKGLLVGGGTQDLSVVRSLLAHNVDRNPYVKGGTRVLFANNVVYDWASSRATYFDDSDGEGTQHGTVVGNAYLAGPATETGQPIRIYGRVTPRSRFYVADNSLNRAPPPADPWSLVRNDMGQGVQASSPPVVVPGLTILPVGQVEEWVLANAGAWPVERDAVDARVVADVRAGTGAIIDSPAQVGGWPELAVTSRALAVPAEPAGDDDGDGYTNLEEWLEEFARVATGAPPPGPQRVRPD
jgi:hypothetical protein